LLVIGLLCWSDARTAADPMSERGEGGERTFAPLYRSSFTSSRVDDCLVAFFVVDALGFGETRKIMLPSLFTPLQF
jgi:hypothetical protein